jgi:uncharacterized membrane protein YdfJ with MMPL/SSD domain
MVPAIVVLCRRWNWWPSHLARSEAQVAVDPGDQAAAVVKT